MIIVTVHVLKFSTNVEYVALYTLRRNCRFPSGVFLIFTRTLCILFALFS